MRMLTAIPVCREDAIRAELLLDLIYQLDGKKPKGHALLAFAPEVHQEMRDKLKIAALLAFETVDVFDIKQLIVADKEKRSAIWSMFFNVAQHISQNYRWPWLWLEPDCMPVAVGWREKLSEAYDNQPRRYLSRWMNAGDVKFCHRVGIYPPNVMGDIQGAQTAQVPFDASIIDRSTKSDLFQQINITSKEEVSRIRQDAVLIHHDKQGVLADWVRGTTPKAVLFHREGAGMIEAYTDGSKLIERVVPTCLPASNGVHKRRGRPPKVSKSVIV